MSILKVRREQLDKTLRKRNTIWWKTVELDNLSLKPFEVYFKKNVNRNRISATCWAGIRQTSDKVKIAILNLKRLLKLII